MNVQTQVNDLSKSSVKIIKFVKDYLQTLEDLSYNNTTPHQDPTLLCSSLLQTIKSKLTSDVINQIDERWPQLNTFLMDPSEDSLVMDRLGCNHCCPMCTAVCWGQYGHEKSEDDTKRHHTSHQPFGLAGKKYKVLIKNFSKYFV